MRYSREARNKLVALDAIGLIERALDTDSMGLLDLEFDAFHERWTEAGVSWTRRLPAAFDFDDWLPATEMAEYADVEPATVRRWHLRGHITADKVDGVMHYNVGEVIKYLAKRDNTKKDQA
jgi:hypothetical protein